MNVIFFPKDSKFYINVKNAIKLAKNVFRFEDNSSWPCCGNSSQLKEEYLWSAANMLQNGPKISDATKSHDTQLNLFDINGKLA